MTYIISGFCLTVVISYIVLKMVPVQRFLDRPDDKRKIHTKLVPRFGGVPFAMVMSVLMMVLWGREGTYTWLFVGYCGILVIGFLDDTIGLSWKIKTLGQIVIGMMICQCIVIDIPMIQFFSFQMIIPSIAVYSVFIVWLLGITNAVNLIDGMDGLAGSVVLLISIGMAYVGYITGNIQFLIYAATLTACLYGFLCFNTRPAKFFMGDTGSLFLGFNLAISPILFYMSSQSSQLLDITPFIVLFTYLIGDTLRVFCNRIKQRKNPMMADMTHFHHDVFKVTQSYNATLLVIFTIQAGLVISCFFSIPFMNQSIIMLGVYLCSLTTLIFVPSSIKMMLVVIEKLVSGIDTVVNNREISTKKLNQNSIKIK